MTILGWVLFGFVVGWIARVVVPGRDPMGLIGTIVLGILGAVLAGWAGELLGWYRPDQSAGFLSATLGAIFVLAIYHAMIRSVARRERAQWRRRRRRGGRAA